MRAGVRSGHRLLDCACGTGVMAGHAQSLVGVEGDVIALNPSLQMLGVAASRGVRHRLAGIAEQLPLPDRSFDFVTMGYALRHVADLGVAFAEFARVLRPGGRLLILEMVPPASRAGYLASRLYLKHLVPTIALFVTGSGGARRLMQYYWDTIDQCVEPEVVLSALRVSRVYRGRPISQVWATNRIHRHPSARRRRHPGASPAGRVKTRLCANCSPGISARLRNARVRRVSARRSARKKAKCSTVRLDGKLPQPAERCRTLSR